MARFSRFGMRAGLGLDYTLHKKNNFNLSISSNSFGNNNNGYLNQSQSTSDNNGFPVSDVFTLSETQSDFRLHEINTSLDYKRTFHKENQELDIGIHSSFGGSFALTTTNIFSEYINQTTQLYGQGFTTTSTRKVPFRYIGINFTWKFGKLEFKKPKPENTDNAPSVD